MAQTDRERQDALVVTTVALTALSFIVVVTRSVVRIALIRKGGWDDYLMIVAMVSLHTCLQEGIDKGRRRWEGKERLCEALIC